jgi:O-methyltransferase
MAVYNTLNVLLILSLIGFSAYYFWDWVQGNDRKPAAWTDANKRDLVPQKVQKIYRKYADKDRFMIFWLQMQRLEKENIQGAIAELGVYRGETATLLHALAPDRELHLFDTFSGFSQEDLVGESGEAATYTTANFADTSLEFVQNHLGYSNKILYHEGNIAEVSKLLPDLRFALVSLDADLAKPTAAGLDYFYPRMQPGGIIIIHDYNPKWPGLVQVVDGFLKTIPETPVLMPDVGGSLVIVRNQCEPLSYKP